MRDATLSDLQGIKTLYHLIVANNPNNLYYRSIDEVTDEVIKKKINDDGVSLILKKNGIIIAFGYGKQKDGFRHKHIVENCTLIVHPSHRNAMIGTLLAKAFFKKCLKKGYRYAWIEYPSTNVKSVKMQYLFGKIGYKSKTFSIPDGVFLSNGKQVDMIYTIFDLQKTKTIKKQTHFKSHLLLFFASPYTYIFSQILWRICKKTILRNHTKVIAYVEDFCQRYRIIINGIIIMYVMIVITLFFKAL